jgi:hypothetical protein
VGPEPVEDETGQLAATAAKYDLGGHEDLLLDALGELPPGYGQTYLSLAARDPEWIFAFWDVNDPDLLAEAEQVGWDRLILRVHRLGGPSFDVGIGPRGGRWYVKAPAAGGRYYGELGLQLPDGGFRRFAVSNEIRTPPSGPSDDARPALATLPWDFDRTRIAGEPSPPSANAAEERPDARLRARLERAEKSAAGRGERAVVDADGAVPREEARPSDGRVHPAEPAATPRVHERTREQGPSSAEPPPGAPPRRPAPSSRDLQAPSSSTRPPGGPGTRGD